MRQIALPDWTEDLPDHTLLTSAEVATFFGYNNEKTLYTAIRSQNIVEPDERLPRKNKTPQMFWRLSTLREIRNKQKEGKTDES